jgi:hypothetical protein
MEKLKDLDKLTAPDSRHDALLALVADEQDGTLQLKTRRLTAADRHEAVAALELSESVPETVRSAFAVVRNLWLYGWFCWPFYTLAEFHATLCLNMALAIRITREDGITDPNWWVPSIRDMLKRAIESKWVSDNGIAHVQRLRERSARMRDELPEGFPKELFGASPDLLGETPQRYCQILLEGLPSERDLFAHPKNYWHGMPGPSLLTIENVHGLIQQLFHDDVVKS